MSDSAGALPRRRHRPRAQEQGQGQAQPVAPPAVAVRLSEVPLAAVARLVATVPVAARAAHVLLWWRRLLRFRLRTSCGTGGGCAGTGSGFVGAMSPSGNGPTSEASISSRDANASCAYAVTRYAGPPDGIAR